MTTYYVSRDTASENATDETRAMAHVSIYRGDSLTDAQAALKRALRDEADDLTRGREVTNSMDVWAFKRAVAMMELADDVASMDPHQGTPNLAPIITREAEGLLFTITAR